MGRVGVLNLALHTPSQPPHISRLALSRFEQCAQDVISPESGAFKRLRALGQGLDHQTQCTKDTSQLICISFKP